MFGGIKMKEPKVKPKTDAECAAEIDGIISGKNKSMGARIVRAWIKGRQTIEPMEQIRANLIKEYKQKYGELASGKKTIKDIQREVKVGSEVTKPLNTKEDKV
jgi:hypothetical protein